MSLGPKMTGPQSCLQTSSGFVWTLPIDVLGYGECQMSVLLQFVWQNMIGLAGAQSWFGQGKTDPHIIDNGTLTALRYVNEILDLYVRPYAGAVGENFILMDDNVRAHRARITDQYLEQATIVRMEWPARSPDLNPIEHAWDMLQTAVSSRPVQPASVQELRQALLEEWDQIPQYKIRRLISSMRRRCQAVIEARGHHTCIKLLNLWKYSISLFS